MDFYIQMHSENCLLLLAWTKMSLESVTYFDIYVYMYMLSYDKYTYILSSF